MAQGVVLKAVIVALTVLVGSALYFSLWTGGEAAGNNALFSVGMVNKAPAVQSRELDSAEGEVAALSAFQGAESGRNSKRFAAAEREPETDGERNIERDQTRAAVQVVHYPEGEEVDNFELAFLQLAYQQASTEDPQLAAEILRQIDALSAGVESDSTGNDPSGVQPEATEQVAESSDPPTDDDFPWCRNRPPVEPETFRCPCPSDPGYRSYWRAHMNPAIAAAAGC